MKHPLLLSPLFISFFVFTFSTSALADKMVDSPNAVSVVSREEIEMIPAKDVMKMINDMRSEYRAEIKDLKNEVVYLRGMVEDTDENRQKEIFQINDKVDNLQSETRDIKSALDTGGTLNQVKESIFDSGFGNISVGGYADIEYENFDGRKSTFDQHRWIINIGAELSERLIFFSEYEIEHGGPDASGSGSAKVEQAWIDFLINEAINFRAGAVMVPFGRYNIYHDSHLQDLTDRPLVVRRITPSTWTESGAGFHGALYPTEDIEMTYEVYAINGINAGITDTGLRSATGSLQSDNNNGKAFTGRITASPALGHEFGVSGYIGDYDSDSNILYGAAFDWLNTFGPLELVGEAAFFAAEDATNTDVPDLLAGFYTQANYHFWPSFLDDTFLKTNFDDPVFTAVARYGYAFIEDDADAGIGDNEAQRITFGLNYRPVPSWVFKTEYQINQRQNEALERGSDNGFMASVAMGF